MRKWSGQWAVREKSDEFYKEAKMGVLIYL
jgi:hypothetical protein